MKKFILGFTIGALLTMPLFAFSASNLADRLKGKILLAVEDHGKTYYVHEDGNRYRITSATAHKIFEKLALGITDKDLEEIPLNDVGINPKSNENSNELKQCLLDKDEWKNKYYEMNNIAGDWKKNSELWENKYNKLLTANNIDANSDTDGDGIINSLDSHPNGGGRLIAQQFNWEYGKKAFSWTFSIHSDWYDYYKNKKRVAHGAEYVTYTDKHIIQIADMLKQKADENNYTNSEFAVAFVQSFNYISDSSFSDDDYPKYPLETLVEQNGDCEDTSYLATAIIRAMPIDCILVNLTDHMAIAIAFDASTEGYYYKLSNNRTYYYIETSSKGWKRGEIPDEYKNETATLIKIPSNEREQVKPSYIPFTKECYKFSEYLDWYFDGDYYYYDSQCTKKIVI